MRRALGLVLGTAAGALVVLILTGSREESLLFAEDGVKQTAYVKASVPGEGDQFGAAVALSADGTTMAIGATGEGSASRGVNGDQKNDDADDSGAVYVYVRNNKGEWTPQAFLKASNADSLDQFGTNLAISADGNTLVVGAYSYSTIVYAMVFGMVLWNDRLTALEWAGIAVIVASGIIAMRVEKKEQIEEAGFES